MNGRLYDPVLGRFLSPDNYVQAADFSQSFNRYSYCWNNPLKYADPSGDFVLSLLAAAFFPPALPYTMYADAACWGAAFNVAANWDDIEENGGFGSEKFWAYAGFGAANGLGAASGNLWIITATEALQSGGNQWVKDDFKYSDKIWSEATWGGITSLGFAYLTLPSKNSGLDWDGKISSYLLKHGWSERTSKLLGSATINFTYNLFTNSIYNRYLHDDKNIRDNWFDNAISEAALSTVFDMGFNYVQYESGNILQQKVDKLKSLDREALKYYWGNGGNMPSEFRLFQTTTPQVNPTSPNSPGGIYTLPILNLDKTR